MSLLTGIATETAMRLVRTGLRRFACPKCGQKVFVGKKHRGRRNG